VTEERKPDGYFIALKDAKTGKVNELSIMRTPEAAADWQSRGYIVRPFIYLNDGALDEDKELSFLKDLRTLMGKHNVSSIWGDINSDIVFERNTDDCTLTIRCSSEVSDLNNRIKELEKLKCPDPR
jgi:hypothetical protein